MPSVKGKIAVVLEGDWSNRRSGISRKMQRWLAVLKVMVRLESSWLEDPSDIDRNRIAVLAEDFRDDLPTRLTPMGVVDSPEYPKIPVVVIVPRIRPGDWLRNSESEAHQLTATMTVDVERKTFKTQNVLGLIEGRIRRSRTRSSWSSALHYDHDGEAYGQIWYGADDNGSGTVGLAGNGRSLWRCGPASGAQHSIMCVYRRRERECSAAATTSAIPLFR